MGCGQVERLHSARAESEKRRALGASMRERERMGKMQAWHSKVASASMRMQASSREMGVAAVSHDRQFETHGYGLAAM